MGYSPIDLQIMEMHEQEEEKERLDRFRDQWKFYYGHVPNTLTVKLEQPDDNVKLNLMRLIVDKGVSFLVGKEVQFNTDEEKTRNPQEQYLDQVWRANKKRTFLQTVALAGGICGEAFVKVMPPDASHPMPRLINLDPATVSARWDLHDVQAVQRYTIQYTSMDPVTNKPIAVRQIIQQENGRWHIIDQVSSDMDPRWQTTGDAWWKFSWSPIHHCQNLPAPNEFWGLSDIEHDVRHIEQVINRVSSNVNKILRLHAHPKTILTGAILSEEQATGPDQVYMFDSPDAKMTNLEMQTDLGSSLTYYDKLLELLHEVVRVPEIATGKARNLGALSGVALQVMYAPLVEKSETKRCTYGDLFSDLNSHLLEMGGHGADNVVKNQWPTIVPQNAEEEAKTALVWQQIGVSASTLMEKAGFDPEVEAERNQVTTQTAGDQMLAAMGKGIGSDGQTLAQ